MSLWHIVKRAFTGVTGKRDPYTYQQICCPECGEWVTIWFRVKGFTRDGAYIDLSQQTAQDIP